ncbi:MAG: hypothetical protein HYX71_05010 [Opitutae bacterium]|nr:hypothetical protein [Opitutae bacterium]
MNLDPAPRLPKWIFLVIDLGLLLTAFIIVYFAKNPYAPVPLISAVSCIGLAAIIGLVPFLVDYAADSAEYVQQERARIADQVQRLNAAGESLARAAAQIKAVEEAVHKTAHAAENLPYRMQEKLAEFNQQLASAEDEEKERLSEELATLRQSEGERLTALADKIGKTLAELTALDASTRKQLAAAQDAAAGKFESRLSAAVAALETKLATISIPVAAPTPAPAEPAEAKAPPSVGLAKEDAPVVESVTVMGAPAPAAEEPKPKKPRAPRKPKPEDTLAAMSEPMPGDPPAAEASGESAQPDTPARGESSEPAEAPAPAEASVSADGATRLLVTAYIGIGNKLYIRGDGPGLSWDKGVPMKFVSIGKWGWATDEATGPVACKLYKNDETAALSGDVFLEPGQHVEVTALF